MFPNIYKLRNNIFMLFCLVLFLALQSVAYAQSGSVRGRVLDVESNEPLPGANVMIQGTTFGAATDVFGNYHIRNVPAGQHTVMVSYLGYEGTSLTVTVEPNRVLEQDFRLQYTVLMGQTITITAQGEGQVSAIQQQLTSNKIVNVVSEARIQELPDFNAAQALSRLPGISTLKSSGEDNKVVIRGLAPEYNAISVGGVRMASTGSSQIGISSQGGTAGNIQSDRSVDLSMITPYMIQSIAVYKALTPDMNANAIGGVVNMELREAPSGFRGDVLWQSGYTAKSNTYSNYRAVVSGSNRFFNDRLGAYALLNIESYDRDADNMNASYGIAERVPDREFSIVRVNNVTLNRHIENRTRYGANLILDYRLPNGSIKSTNMYSRLRSDFQDHRMIMSYFGRLGLTFRYDEGINDVDAAVNSIRFNYDLGPVLVDMTVANTYSRNFLPDSPRLTFFHTGGITGPVPQDTRPEDLITLINYRGSDSVYLESISLFYSKYTENNQNVDLNFEIPFNLGPQFSGSFKLGGVYRRESRENDQETPYAAMDRGHDYQNRMIDDLIARYGVDYDPGTGMFSGTTFIAQNPDLFDPFLDDRFGSFLFAPDPTIPVQMAHYLSTSEWEGRSTTEATGGWFRGLYQQIANDYEYTENHYAAYAMAELNFLDFLLVGGVRYEREEAEFSAINMVDVRQPQAQTYFPITAYPENEFLLPMVQVRYKPFAWGDIRYAYTHTLARPQFHQLSPRFSMDYTGGTVWAGNPDLKTAKAINHDLILTIYSNRVGLLSIGGFYKTIQNFSFYTQYALFENNPDHLRKRSDFEPLPRDGATLNTYMNTPYDSYVKGIEVDFQTRLWYLPGALNGIVLGINYTHIQSEATYPNRFNVQVPNPDAPRPPFILVVKDSSRVGRLINQPNDILNTYIGYDYRAFSTRVSFTFQGEAVNGIGIFPEQDGFTKDYFRVDFSARQKLPYYGLEIYVDVNNLNNRSNVAAQRSIGGFTNEQNYGLTANLGVRFRL